ncbi:MAG: hypothetical protein R2875_03365 [Desulfobacterales bacterium]
MHLEVVQERFPEREYDLSLIITALSVEYEIEMTDGTVMMIDNPALYPDPGKLPQPVSPTSKHRLLCRTTHGAGDEPRA